MVKQIIFKKIKFGNFDSTQFEKLIIKKGLFVFPAGPALASIQKSNQYYNSLKKSDFIFFDSGLFVLLLGIFKNIKVNKFSGYKFLSLFFNYIKRYKNLSIFCIDPNLKFSKSNKKYLKKLGLKKINNYVAPKYQTTKLTDKKLLKLISKHKPAFILINIGGGVQEILGLYLKNNLKFTSTILCTGGAISFFTKDQAPINNFIDKFYLGWLIRLIFNPFIFFKRYFFGLKLIPMVISSEIKIIK